MSTEIFEKEWSVEPATATSGQQQEQQVALLEERMKLVLKEKRDHLLNITQNDNGPSFTTLVKVCWGIALLMLFVLICYVGRKYFNIQSDEYEAVLLSGDKISRLRALKNYNIENISTLFTLVLGVAVLAFFTMFGNYIHYSNAKMHESRKRGNIMRKATELFGESESYISKLNRNLGKQEVQIQHLASSENRLENEIRELKKDAKQNNKQIKELERQRTVIEEELSKTQKTKDFTETYLKDAKNDLKKLQSKFEEKDTKLNDTTINYVKVETEKNILEQREQARNSCIIS